MSTAFLEKTIKFLAKSENPASQDILRICLDDRDGSVKEDAFDALYLKRDPSIYIELFLRFLKEESFWLDSEAVNPDRLARLAEAAIHSNDDKLLKAAFSMILKHKIYDGLKSILPLLESPKEYQASLAGKAVLELADKFYEELASCATPVELRNMDRMREWFSSELENPVRRYSVHGMIEPLKAFLLVTKKDYASFLAVMGDHHSQAAKTIMDLLETGVHGSYIRLLLSFIDDVSSPPQIDLIIGKRQDDRFIQFLLKAVGTTRSVQEKQPLKRFKGFSWLEVNNPLLPELIKGLEPNFVQLFTSISLPREQVIELLRFTLKNCSPEGRRAAVESLRALAGDDFNLVILEATDDPDPLVCSLALRLVKNRNMKDADQVLMKCVERDEPDVLNTIYELVPDFHIESYLQKVEQLNEPVARALGRIVRRVDPNLDKILTEELGSRVAIRRSAAVNTLRYMNLGKEYQNDLCRIAIEDEETNLRIAACNALSEVLTMEAIQTLKAATEERAFVLRNAATQAVQKWMELYNRSKVSDK